MITGTLSRYFGWRFLSAVLAVFAGTLVLTAMIDFLELLRRSADIKDVSALLIAQITLFRVPFITERVMPFAVLVGAMFCYLNLSRRLELVVARAAGISAWQFIAPALVIASLIGLVLTTPTQRRRPVGHQRKNEPPTGNRIGRRERFPLRRRRPLP
jgi:lipopolysaccharide export system permease protein